MDYSPLGNRNVHETFDQAYSKVLFDLLYFPQYKNVQSRIGPSSEIVHYNFILKNPMAKFLMAPQRNFKFGFADKFFNWIWEGDGDMSKMIPHNDKTNKYMDEDMTGRNTAYGPRLVSQRESIIEELVRDKNSRRGSIMILYPSDSEMLIDSFEGKTKQEYPCTIALQFMIREDKLDLHVLMRSNNAVTTLCYDVYVFTHIMQAMCDELKLAGVKVTPGFYYHTSVSMHLFDTDIDLASKITAWYIERSRS